MSRSAEAAHQARAFSGDGQHLAWTMGDALAAPELLVDRAGR